jgi:cobalt-zinc-cadmium efflux system outer membrane protein
MFFLVKNNKLKVNSKSLITNILMVVLLSGMSSCAFQKYEPEPIETNQTISHLTSRDVNEPGFIDFMHENGIAQWPVKQWNFEEITLAALYFNPQLEAEFAEYNLSEAQALLLLQRENPVIGVPLEHHSDTSNGVSPWTIGLLFDFIFERPAKRRAKQDRAQAEIQAALVGVSESVWDLRSEVKLAWIKYTSALILNDYIKDELKLLEDSHELLHRQHELGESSYFEVSNTRLEMQRLKLESSHHQVVVSDDYHELLALIGLSPEKMSSQDFILSDDETLPGVADISQLTIQNMALHERYDIKQAMFEYQAHEAALRLEIERQYPDITLSPGFIFDQGDKIWALATSWVLPVFHHNEAQINEALAKRQVLQKEFQVLQSNLIHELAKKQHRYFALTNSLQQAEALVNELKEREGIFQKQYDSGYTGKLDLLRNQLETLRAKRAHFEIRVSVNKSLAELEDLIQTSLQDEFDSVQVIKSLSVLNKITDE